ncbi:hypothetical protein H6G04_02615 [Calothrix membranacea FACHB-236]|nr:hypothetical protein [Calothrix membranacea FACHB-236]
MADVGNAIAALIVDERLLAISIFNNWGLGMGHWALGMGKLATPKKINTDGIVSIGVYG